MRHGFVFSILIYLVACVPPSTDPVSGHLAGPIARAAHEASRETGVPPRLLLAVGYVESRWRTPEDAHASMAESHASHGARGLMGVTDRPDAPWLEEGARALGVDVERAAQDAPTNIHIAANLLRDLATADGGGLPEDLEGWRDAVARYRAGSDPLAGPSYADHVFDVLAAGASGYGEAEEWIELSPSSKEYGRARKPLASAPDFAGARWIPAKWDHFRSGRSAPISHVIIHTTEGSYEGAISWFRSEANPWKTSAHYVVRSSDGEVTQMVREEDSAYHIGDWNPLTVGIEHEARAGEGYLWFTDAMLRSSAAITRSVCLKYGIPMDRAHIIGHVEVPGATHWDPGPHFPWDAYLAMVLDPGAEAAVQAPDACGGLDYIGECQGSWLRWCDAGRLREMDCAPQGTACGWQDDNVGYNCVSAPPPPPPPVDDPCAGLDYAGECQGGLLRWCEGGSIRKFDCAASGRSCGWQDDSVGNNCL